MASDALSLTFGALADPTRRAILARLVEGDAAVSDLARPHDMSLPAISKHLKVLERAGLVQRSRDGRWRPCALDATPLRDVADWVGAYRRFWQERFDRLDVFLQNLKREQHRAIHQRKVKRRGRRRG